MLRVDTVRLQVGLRLRLLMWQARSGGREFVRGSRPPGGTFSLSKIDFGAGLDRRRRRATLAHVGGHELGIDGWSRSSISVWRKRMREERLQALLQKSLAVATGTPR
jgi:hypothetical protein